MTGALHVEAEVGEALAAGAPVVALETSVVAHGLPPPHGLDAADRCARAVREAGAVPAFVAVVGGRVVVGASHAELARLAHPGARPAKAGVRDLAACVARGVDAGTTVSATVAVAARAGIHVFATGGIGGVHRAAAGSGAAWDVSSDLAALARAPVCVVAAGPKAILDVAATAEALESLCVPVLGYGTADLPAFYVAESGVRLEHRLDDVRDVAALLRHHWGALGRTEGVLLCVPPPRPLPRDLVESALATAMEQARAAGVAGKSLTPFLIAALDRATEGQARAANVELLERDASVAGRLAVALAAPGGAA